MDNKLETITMDALATVNGGRTALTWWDLLPPLVRDAMRGGPRPNMPGFARPNVWR